MAGFFGVTARAAICQGGHIMQIFRLTSGMTTADGLRKTKHMAPLACDTGDREHGKGQPIERLSAPFV
jgi:hypothetical protein